jgi:putative restriction endonuclease
MPALSPTHLASAILDAIEQSGESGALLSGARTHPRKFVIAGAEGPVSLWVYAWTLTPGGRPQLVNEYRIQMTTVDSPLSLNPAGPTVLMGYEPSLKVFGGFDLERHRTFTAGSPSVQIDVTSLREALQDGLAFHRKSNEEITVAVRPDQFMTYARNAAVLHKTGRDLPTFRALARAAARQPIPLPDIDSLSTERKRVVQTIIRKARAANFSLQVLQAYGHRCAITRLQLRLVDAAHILPVEAPGSPDDVRNGIALSPTYHRAFDRGLIYLGDDYTMRVNESKVGQLTTLRLDGGLDDFRRSLGRIHLPPDNQQWPHLSLVKKANRFRGISG